MTPGVLRKRLAGGDLTATAMPGGWQSASPDLLRHLRACYPPPPTEAGTPWVIAFWSAVDGLGAEVVTEPEADPWQGGGMPTAEPHEEFCGGPGSGVPGPCPTGTHDDAPKGDAPAAAVDVHPAARAVAVKLFGRDLADHEYAAMACAPPGASVRVTASGGKLALTSEKVAADGTLEFNSSRSIYKPWFSGVTCQNKTFGLRGEGKGGGLALFDGQVKALQAAGVKTIQTSAAGSPSGGGNGYYTWPRMGYGGPMSSQQIGRLPPEIQKALGGKSDIRDLFDLPGGPEAWKAHGGSINLTFDTTPGSRNIKALEAYKAQRAAKG